MCSITPAVPCSDSNHCCCAGFPPPGDEPNYQLNFTLICSHHIFEPDLTGNVSLCDVIHQCSPSTCYRFNQHSMNVLKASLTSEAAPAPAAKAQQNGQSNGEASSAHSTGPDPAAKKVRCRAARTSPRRVSILVPSADVHNCPVLANLTEDFWTWRANLPFVISWHQRVM